MEPNGTSQDELSRVRILPLLTPPKLDAPAGFRLGNGSTPESLLEDWQLKKKYDYEKSKFKNSTGLHSAKFRLHEQASKTLNKDTNVKMIHKNVPVSKQKVRLIRKGPGGIFEDAGTLDIYGGCSIQAEKVFNPMDPSNGKRRQVAK